MFNSLNRKRIVLPADRHGKVKRVNVEIAQSIVLAASELAEKAQAEGRIADMERWQDYGFLVAQRLAKVA